MKRRRFGKKTRATTADERWRLREEAQALLPSAGADGAGDDGWSEDVAPSPPRAPRRTRAEDQEPTVAAGDELATGVVVAVTSGGCRIDADGERVRCVLPSRLARAQQSRLAVGDRVRWLRRDDGSAWLAEVLPRDTALSRPDPRNPRRSRVLAANVDLAVHVASLRQPPLRPALIDRFLIAIDDSGAEPLVCVNKIDLVPPEERPAALAPLDPYRALGLDVALTSAHTGEGVEDLRRRLAGRTAVLVGHSGVGKSSLLNALAGDRRARTATVDRKYGKGRHTTTGARLHRLPGGGLIIDTPGIRELGLGRLDPAWLARSFPDFRDLAPVCRFNDCSHLHEPGCAVRAALEDGRVARERYDVYARIRDSLEPDAP